MLGQAAAMGVRITNGDFARHPRIIQLECWVEAADFRVPRNFSLAHQGSDDCGAKRVRDRRKLKDRVRVHGCGFAHFAYAEAFGVHHCILKHYRDGETWHYIVSTLLLREPVQLFNCLLYLRFGHSYPSLRGPRGWNKHAGEHT